MAERTQEAYLTAVRRVHTALSLLPADHMRVHDADRTPEQMARGSRTKD
jgi:hypothetical protein